VIFVEPSERIATVSSDRAEPRRCRQWHLVTRSLPTPMTRKAEKGVDGKRRYTVAEIAETFHVSRKTIYRHLEPTLAATSSPAG
jgi:HTH domain